MGLRMTPIQTDPRSAQVGLAGTGATAKVRDKHRNVVARGNRCGQRIELLEGDQPVGGQAGRRWRFRGGTIRGSSPRR